jgi:hypothetical protein
MNRAIVVGKLLHHFAGVYIPQDHRTIITAAPNK